MDAQSLQIFLEEAEGYLPLMREGIMAYEKDATRLAELQSSRRLAHTIKGSASMLEQAEISEIAREIEGDLKPLIISKSVLSEGAASDLLSKILVLEAYLSELRARLATAESQKNAEHVESSATQQSVVSPRPAAAATVAAAEQNPLPESEDFEIDAEMLEIFSEEAEDLLRNINVNLDILEKTPNNRAALLQIRHSSHTLKGSGGIVGLKNLSALAHRVEDLLDYLAEKKIESNQQIFELLIAATDCLSALADGDNSAEIHQKIKRLYQTFDEVFTQLKAAAEAAAPVAAPAKVAPPNAAASLETGKKSNACDQSDLLGEESVLTLPGEAPDDDAAAAADKKPENALPETVNPATRSVARVSLERLDELFNLVGEMVNNRSFFKQRLSELEQQIEELHHTTRRLRLSSGKLETDFEAAAAPGSENFTAPNYSFGARQLNSFANLKAQEFDTLEFDRYTEFHQTTREFVETASDASAINSNLDNLLDNLNLLFENQHRLLEGMQDNLLRLRMVSLNSLAQRLHRTVRVTAQEEGKCVDLAIENDTVEIDTEILDSFVEPLLHILRNAVAHGIEPPETRRLMGKPEKGKITLRAYSEGTHIVFVISDDGRGISASDLKEKAVQMGFTSREAAARMSDEEAFALIFLPGLSTAAEINQVSGRGVGMNIVKTNIARRQGTISVKSETARGTVFTVRLPVALAVTRALLVKAAVAGGCGGGAQTFAFPLKLVKHVTEISQAEFEKARRDKILTVGKTAYSFFHFNQLLNLPSFPAAVPDSKIPLLLIETSETPCALAIDQILRTEEIVIKPLGATFAGVPEIIGATILGDGCAVPVLDLVYLLKKPPVQLKKPPLAAPEKKSKITVMIVDDSPSVRQINLKLAKNAGWQAIVAKDGLEALEILQALRELPDIVLTDVEMPRMDGYEFLASLKRQPATRSIPVIMITSRAGEKHRRKAFDLGVSEYLSKPYEDAALINAVKRLTR